MSISFPSFQDLLSRVTEFDDWWTLLPRVAVVAGFGGAFYLVVRLRRFARQLRENRKKVDDELTALRNGQPDGEKLKRKILLEVTDGLQKLNLRVQSMEDSLRDLPSQIKDLDTRIKALEPDASASKAASVVELPAAIIDETDPEPAPAKPPGQLSIERMLVWAQDAGLALKPVKATLGLFGNFCFSAEGDNWLAESNKSTEASFLFPRSERFETAAHYDMYRDYYECVQPAAGRILIQSPATVVIDSEQGGWKLFTKGELSVIP
jgi:hypothetical protein